MEANFIHSIQSYFESIPSSHRALILAGGIAFFWILENGIPLIRFSYKKWSHAGLNLFFTATTIVINFLFAVLIIKASDWTIQHEFGLLPWLNPSLGLEILVGLLFLDLISAYFIHWIEHKIKFLWRFHLIHHADIYVDTTTANRHHPGESVIRAIFTLLAVFLCGAPIYLVMLYQSISVVLSQFNHANISLPPAMDKAISWIIVSPNMHKVHHHFKRPQTDSNYGNIFSIWDRIFGTFQVMNPKDLVYGVDQLEDQTHNQLKFQLKIPFIKIKDVDSKF